MEKIDYWKGVRQNILDTIKYRSDTYEEKDILEMKNQLKTINKYLIKLEKENKKKLIKQIPNNKLNEGI